MKAKEKAQEYFNKVKEVIASKYQEHDVDTLKAVALIVANEVLFETDWRDAAYWQEVKEEIEKL